MEDACAAAQSAVPDEANGYEGEDPDGDGRTNKQEFNAGTNPIVAEDWEKAATELEELRKDDEH